MGRSATRLWASSTTSLLAFSLCCSTCHAQALFRAQNGAVLPKSYVTSDASFSTGSTNTFTDTVTAGNAIAGYVGWLSSSVTLTSVTVCGQTTTLVGNPTTNGGIREAGFYIFSSVGGASCTFTATMSGSVSSYIAYHEIKGAVALDATSVFGSQTNVASCSGGDCITSGNLTTVTNGDYVFGATFTNLTLATTFTAGGNPVVFTGHEFFFDAGHTLCAGTEFAIQSSAAAIAATFGSPNGPIPNALTIVMAFR